MAVKLHRCRLERLKFGPCWRVEKALKEMGIDYELAPGPSRPVKRDEIVEQTGQKLYPAIECWSACEARLPRPPTDRGDGGTPSDFRGGAPQSEVLERAPAMHQAARSAEAALRADQAPERRTAADRPRRPERDLAVTRRSDRPLGDRATPDVVSRPVPNAFTAMLDQLPLELAKRRHPTDHPAQRVEAVRYESWNCNARDAHAQRRLSRARAEASTRPALPMILRCTAKVLTLLGTRPAALTDTPPSADDWSSRRNGA